MVGSGAVFILTFYLVGYFLAIIIGYPDALVFWSEKQIKNLFHLFDGDCFPMAFHGIMRLNDLAAPFDLRPYTSIISGE